MFVDPFATHHELVPEVADMGDRTAEACEPELREGRTSSGEPVKPRRGTSVTVDVMIPPSCSVRSHTPRRDRDRQDRKQLRDDSDRDSRGDGNAVERIERGAAGKPGDAEDRAKDPLGRPQPLGPSGLV